MKAIFTVLLILNIVFVPSISCLYAQTIDVLFIGNSLTGWNDMPAMVRELCNDEEKLIEVDKFLLYGRSLYEITLSSNLERKINSQKWEYIIAQESSYKIAYPSEFNSTSSFRIALKRIMNLADANYEGTQIVMFMPWAYKDGKFWDEENPDDYFEMQNHIYENSVIFADDLNVTIAPIGSAWNKILLEKDSIDLFESDFTHPTVEGSYTTACVIYSTLFQETLNNNYVADLPIETAEYIQSVSSQTVMDNLEDWNLVTNILHEENKIITKSQNYPNPFNSQTTISFYLDKRENIKVELFNSLGEKIESIFNGELNVGNQNILLDANDLSSGIYYYRLLGKTINITKSMILIK